MQKGKTSGVPVRSLPIVIFRDGRPIRVVHLDDPRPGFCAAYNEMGLRTRAQPLVKAICLASET